MEYIEWGVPLSGSTPDLPPESLVPALLRACEAHPDIDVVEIRGAPDGVQWHAIVVDVGDGTVASRNAAGIHPRERLALVHCPNAAMPIEVRALRRDFPETLHQNGVLSDEPRSLCLYDQPWSSLERIWTPAKFLTRVLQWLEKTADGSLHAEDQALEQLFFDSGWQVLLPVGFTRTLQDRSKTLRLRIIDESPGRVTLAASFDLDESSPDTSVPIQPLTFEIPGVAHPPIQFLPRSLGDLQERFAQVGTSLFPTLIDAVREVAAGGLTPSPNEKRVKTMLLSRVPRLRNGDVERIDVLGFLVEADIARLGLALGVLQQVQPQGPAFPALAFGDLGTGGNASANPPLDNWMSIGLTPVHIRHRADRATARLWSGSPNSGKDLHGVLAGAGALGSAMAILWAREGWGSWTIVDPDVVEPHNVVRHQAYDFHVGLPKAEVVGMLMQSALGEKDTQAQAIHGKANDRTQETLVAALVNADLLVDATATLEVPRDWSSLDLPRTASVFLAPSGLSSVLLMEDEARTIRVATLEAQYYRAILREDWGAEHLQAPATLRVGAGCRDHSFVMSAGKIGLHASLLHQGLQRAVEQSTAAIRVWSVDEPTGAVAFRDVPPHSVRQHSYLNWTVYWDTGLEAHLEVMRKDALPCETGGILVGVIDHKARSIHLVDAYHAPSDSIASTRDFIRGKRGVADARNDCVERTRGMVDYVGEWHSHPRGISAAPSFVDMGLLGGLARTLAADGVPVLMVIVGHKGDLSITMGEAI
ncbi:MAG: hypothetical protein EPN31_06095 [Castellaniella sp.]|uniref:ThiF family adenylyltransferase n=1 Tax=Castellaniella sp. TaxID=1955812 RepID=UPI00122AF892|nr:ThiF family adenylyltransferase [Castellaniella sp.]TAN29644.1 MAG: hypothetical protein EPN31_06095 [Castellaniella sp.]